MSITSVSLYGDRISLQKLINYNITSPSINFCNIFVIDVEEKTGQWAFWCEDLNSKNFAGRTDWRRATMQEMLSLYRKVGGSIWNGENGDSKTGEGLGWPASFEYWTMTSGHQDYVPYQGYYDLVNIKNATSWMIGYLSDPAYASCVSETQTTATEK
ncbi:Lcl C-terminal domain-containing protein [Grimontia hollisae]|uniref:hypothetical protein n=1 Tax=Grimontia hollisae TaxID=673 RepID=UPI0013034882|nr:hypothetical protein [Grimontia hollisae]